MLYSLSSGDRPNASPTGGASVNKKELAAIVDCSLSTLSAWIDRFGEAFPVIDRGTNGREWRFDPTAVLGFLKAQRDAEEREAARARGVAATICAARLAVARRY